MSLFTGGIAAGLALAGVGAKAATDLAGASKTAGAAEHGADLQAKAAQEALDFTKAQKAKQEAAYVPFGALGQQAALALPGLARQTPSVGAPAPYTTQPRATMPAQQGAPLSLMGQPQGGPQMPAVQPNRSMMPQGQPSGQMVTLQAPDGTTQAVPVEKAQFYLQRGARRV